MSDGYRHLDSEGEREDEERAAVFAAGYREALWPIRQLRDQSTRTDGTYSRAIYAIDADSLDAALGDRPRQ
jgi:hypothetical protein